MPNKTVFITIKNPNDYLIGSEIELSLKQLVELVQCANSDKTISPELDKKLCELLEGLQG